MCKEESRKNRTFKRREIFKVMKIIEKKIKKEYSFTSLDISQKLAEKKYSIKSYRVANILTMLMNDEEYPELTTTRINVVREDGEVVKATLYHLIDANPFDYMNISQVKKKCRREVDFDDIDFDDDFNDEDDEDLK